LARAATAQVAVVFGLAFLVYEVVSVLRWWPFRIESKDQELQILERLSTHTHKTKAELIRMIVEEYLRDNPIRFRRETSMGVKRKKNIVLPEQPK